MKLNNLIITSGASYAQTKKALEQWIELYLDDLKNGMTFKLFKIDGKTQAIHADISLVNDHFFYLVNYLTYPEGIDYQVEVKGFTEGLDYKILENKELLVFVSPTDEEYDNVYVVSSTQEVYKVDFGGRVTVAKQDISYNYPDNLKLDLSEAIVIDKKESERIKTEKEADNRVRRFIIVSCIILCAYVIALFLQPKDVLLQANLAIGIGVWGWLLFDYKILQSNKLYVASFGLALAIYFYGVFLQNQYPDKRMVMAGASMPIFFLVVQRVLRLLFLGILKREPVVDKPAPTAADFIYMFILLMSTSLIPILYFSK
jgi:hypothetical protein